MWSTIKPRQVNYCESSDEENITSSWGNLIFPQSYVIEFHLYPDSTFDFGVERSHRGTYCIVSYVGTLNRDQLFTSHEPRLFHNDFVSQLIWTTFERVWKVKGSLEKSMNLVKDYFCGIGFFSITNIQLRNER